MVPLSYTTKKHFSFIVVISDPMSNYNAGLKTLLQEGLSEPEFYGDVVYKFRKIVGKTGPICSKRR